MISGVVEWVAWVYVITNSLRVLFYGPQIRAVLRAEDGARALSITTWGFWTFAHLTTTLYGWFVIHDVTFCAIFAGNLVCSGAVTVIAARKRLHARRLTESREAGMTGNFEELMKSARQARRDEMKRLTGFAVSAVTRAANRAYASPVPIGRWIQPAWRLSAEDRPGC